MAIAAEDEDVLAVTPNGRPRWMSGVGREWRLMEPRQQFVVPAAGWVIHFDAVESQAAWEEPVVAFVIDRPLEDGQSYTPSSGEFVSVCTPHGLYRYYDGDEVEGKFLTLHGGSGTADVKWSTRPDGLEP